jgi:hypothetical protein
MPLRPTFYDFELVDGTMVQVTRNFAGLYKLRAYSPELYRHTQVYSQKGKNDSTDDVEMAEVIYGAYVTAMIVDDKQAEIMPMEEFFALMPTDMYAIGNIMQKLFGKKGKKTDSPTPSGMPENP